MRKIATTTAMVALWAALLTGCASGNPGLHRPASTGTPIPSDGSTPRPTPSGLTPSEEVSDTPGGRSQALAACHVIYDSGGRTDIATLLQSLEPARQAAEINGEWDLLFASISAYAAYRDKYSGGYPGEIPEEESMKADEDFNTLQEICEDLLGTYLIQP